MARNGDNGMQRSLVRMAGREPELAARLLVSALPGAAASVPGRLDYRLVLEGLGAYHVAVDGGRAEVTEEHPAAPDGEVDFTLQPGPIDRVPAAA